MLFFPFGGIRDRGMGVSENDLFVRVTPFPAGGAR
jgi:hypothetical protein